MAFSFETKEQSISVQSESCLQSTAVMFSCSLSSRFKVVAPTHRVVHPGERRLARRLEDVLVGLGVQGYLFSLRWVVSGHCSVEM